MPRSACVHPDHKGTVTLALERNGYLTQGDLAINLRIALSTVSRFFRGIRVSIASFEQICEALNLEPREVVLPLPDQSLPDQSPPDHPRPNTPKTPETVNSPSADTAQFFAYDPFWVGREPLITTLTQKLNNGCRLMLLTGLPGIGKTALSERLTTELQQKQPQTTHPRPTPPQGTPHYALLRENFDNLEQPTDFASVAARLLEGCGQSIAPEERGDSKQLMRRLIAHLQTTPTLILIDSLELILQGDESNGWSTFKDDGFLTYFQSMLASPTCQSRLIITSQELPPQMVELGARYPNFWHRQLINGLTDLEQKALFEKTGFTQEANLIRIGKAYEGHPLALRTILGEISDRPFFGNVRAYWKRYSAEIEAVEISLAEAAEGNTTGADDKWQLDRFTRALRYNVQQRLERTFERLRQEARYAYILLCEASVYRCAVPEDWWLSHLEDWEQDEAQQLIALDVLRDRYLVEEKAEDTELLLKQHNLIRSVSLAHLNQLTFEH